MQSRRLIARVSVILLRILGGSTFLVTQGLVESPLERLERRGHTPAAIEAAAPPEQTATLLYIEDNLANLSLIETILV
jgi:HAMP domain-containing protein